MKKGLLLLLLLILMDACKPEPYIPDPTRAVESTPTVQPGQTKIDATSTLEVTPTRHPAMQISPDDLSGTQITFWQPWTGELAQSLETIIREFNDTNVWGIQVITTTFGGMGPLGESVDQNLPDGTLPDILIAPSEQLLWWDRDGSTFVDLNPYIEDKLWGMTNQEHAEIPPVYWLQDSQDGRQVGMPVLRDFRVLFYNQTWAKELGYFSSPRTFEDFSTQTCTAAAERKTIDETGGWIIDTNPLTSYSWLLSADNESLYDPGSEVYQFDTRPFSRVFNGLKELSINACIWIPRLPDPYDYFANRQALFYSGSLADILPQTEAMLARENTDQWVILPFPSTLANPPVAVSSGSSIAILRSSPEQQLAAWIFARWLMLPRHQAHLSEISGYLPVSSSAYDTLQNFEQLYPQWDDARAWIPFAASPPQTGSWSFVKNLLEDAAWQMYQPSTPLEDIPVLLEQLDAMIAEVLAVKQNEK